MSGASTTRARWKKGERAIAGKLGGKRVPVSGRARGDAPDIAHPTLSPEVKCRKTLPEWLVDAMDQAKRSAAGGKTPIVILHETGRRHDDDLVVVRLRDFSAGALAAELGKEGVLE